MGSVVQFCGHLWRSAQRPAVFRRCTRIALIIGTLLSLVNQGDAILGGRLDAIIGLRIAANFLIPFVVANMGAMSSLPPRPR
ncbi:MAG: hypothetical protein HY002_05645 [Candidatus Rokubacteria bacterium]|nr:hypothetical protein [Candidatus Rokubacteria bacterium]